MKAHLSVLFLFLTFFSSNLLIAHNADDAVLGIRSSEISAEKAEKLQLKYPYGSRINSTYTASAASAAGLKPLDYIYGINAETVSKNTDLSDLLEKYSPGEAVKVYYVRNGESKVASLVLNRRGDLKSVHRSKNKDPFLGISPQHDNSPQPVEGISVNVIDNSTAQAMGIQDGDIITAIDDYPVFDWHDASPAINNRKVGDPIKISFYRDGAVMKARRPIKSNAATHNNHSRADGPKIIMPDEESSSVTAEVTLTAPQPEEVVAVPELNDEENRPVITSLTVKKLNIFPNPSTGIFDIQFDLSSEGETSIYIYNPSGQAVYFNNLGLFTGTFNDRIDIANGVRGIYFLQIRQGNNLLTQKIVLQ